MGRPSVKLHALVGYLLFRRGFFMLKYFDELGRGSQVVSSQRALLFVKFDNLGNIVKIMPWGIWIEICSYEFLVLGHLRHKFFERL